MMDKFVLNLGEQSKTFCAIVPSGATSGKSYLAVSNSLEIKKSETTGFKLLDLHPKITRTLAIVIHLRFELFKGVESLK